jgi:serine/threonine protein kinase
MEGKHSQFDEY